jgi:hypothetical protein
MSDTNGAGPRGRVRELTPQEVDSLREDLRYLMSESGWKLRDLNRALGFNETSGMLRNILYDKNNKVSTSRARYDAIKRIRDENLKPGIILVQPAPAAAAPARGRRGRRGAAPEPVELNGDGGADEGATTRRRRATASKSATEIISEMAGGAPVVLLKAGATEFSAQQQADGTWRVSLTASCSTDQMSAWARQVMTEQLALAAVPAGVGDEDETPAG